MQHDNLSHTLTVRVSPALRDELADAAAREDITTGEFVRRAVASEIDRRVSGCTATPRFPLALAS